VLTFAAFIFHGIYLMKLKRYLKKNHLKKWEEITPERFLWFSRDDVDIGHYFKEMKFVLSQDNLNDQIVVSLKGKLRLSCIVFFLSLILSAIYL